MSVFLRISPAKKKEIANRTFPLIGVSSTKFDWGNVIIPQQEIVSRGDFQVQRVRYAVMGLKGY